MISEKAPLSAGTEAEKRQPQPAFSRWLDKLVPVNKMASSDDLYRARVLVGIILTYISLLLIGATFFGLFTPLGAQYKTITYVITLCPALLFIAVLNDYRLRGHHNLASNLAVAVAYILIFVGIYISGGPFLSPANYMLPVVPLLGFCFMGIRAGIVWAIIVFLTELTLFLMSFSGFEFPYIVDQSAIHLNESIDWSIAFVAIAAIGFVYESMHIKLKRELVNERQRYQFMASHDPLTRLPNRVLFNDRFETALTRAERDGNNVALLYIDLDGFKPINDSYGHNVGDLVLQEIASRLQFVFRKSETVARLGGDEFAVILEGVDDLSSLAIVRKRLCESITKTIRVENHEVHVGLSIGEALYPRDGKFSQELLVAADKAMYENKNQK